MLRVLLFVVLLAVNGVLAAVQFGWLTWHNIVPARAREPARLGQQLQPGKIVLTQATLTGGPAVSTAGANGTTGAVAPASGAAAVAANGTTADNASAATAAFSAAGPSVVASGAAADAMAATASAAALVCLDVGPFSANDAPQAKGLLLASLPTGQGDMQTLTLDKRYWIHMDPVQNKAAADKQIAQLRAAGVTEYFLVNNEGAAGLVVSLGLFNDRERAQRLMANAQKKGLTPILDERPNARSRVVYRIAGLNATLAAQVRSLVAQQWTARVVSNCPAPTGSPPATAH